MNLKDLLLGKEEKSSDMPEDKEVKMVKAMGKHAGPVAKFFHASPKHHDCGCDISPPSLGSDLLSKFVFFASSPEDAISMSKRGFNPHSAEHHVFEVEPEGDPHEMSAGSMKIFFAPKAKVVKRMMLGPSVSDFLNIGPMESAEMKKKKDEKRLENEKARLLSSPHFNHDEKEEEDELEDFEGADSLSEEDEEEEDKSPTPFIHGMGNPKADLQFMDIIKQMVNKPKLGVQ